MLHAVHLRIYLTEKVEDCFTNIGTVIVREKDEDDELHAQKNFFNLKNHKAR